MTLNVNIRIIGEASASAPVLCIRNEGGSLTLELTAKLDTSNTVQTATELGAWSDWTNVTGNGTARLLPLNGWPNDSARYFRAFSD